MDKMLILLQQLHLENEVSALKHAYIERVIVHKDNSYTFYIGASHIVPLTEIRLLFAAKKEFPYPCEFLFDWASSYTSQDVKEYALFIFDGLNIVFHKLILLKKIYYLLKIILLKLRLLMIFNSIS